MNDAWYASAFWSAFNLEVNRAYLQIERVKIYEQLQDMEKHPVTRDPILIAETQGTQIVEIYQGDFRQLHTVLSPGLSPMTVIDLFNKADLPATEKIRREWQKTVGGEVFIP